MTDDTKTPGPTVAELEAVETVTTPENPAEIWPQAAPNPGAVYGFIDPAWGQQMVALTLETWRNIIADVKTMKTRLDQLSAENIEFKQGRKPNGEDGRIILVNPKGH